MKWGPRYKSRKFGKQFFDLNKIEEIIILTQNTNITTQDEKVRAYASQTKSSPRRATNHIFSENILIAIRLKVVWMTSNSDTNYKTNIPRRKT